MRTFEARMPLRQIKGRYTATLALMVIVWSIFAIVAKCEAESCMDADLLLRNGHIVTMDAARTVASAMAVRDGAVLAVGDAAAQAGCVSARTRVLDLHGQTVLPGLIDVHTHAMEWVKSLLSGEIDAGYPAVHSITEITQAVARLASTLPRGRWIVGAGWDDAKLAERRYITRQDLDAASADDPVYLKHVSGHLGVANSAALKLANISKETPDPVGGVIERDASGEPTGVLKDTAMGFISAILPKEPADINERAARLISEKAAEVDLLPFMTFLSRRTKCAVTRMRIGGAG